MSTVPKAGQHFEEITKQTEAVLVLAALREPDNDACGFPNTPTQRPTSRSVDRLRLWSMHARASQMKLTGSSPLASIAGLFDNLV